MLFPSRNMIEKGRSIAESSCSRCHGMNGISTDEQRPNLAGQRAVYLYRVIGAYQNGHRVDDSMGHASGFLNDEGMLSVAAFYASLAPVRSSPPGDEQAIEPGLADDPFGEVRASLKKCTKCHGEYGNSTASGMPNLTSQDPEYFRASMQAYVDGSRKHKIMKKLAGSLDEQTIGKMGVFYAVQQPVRSETNAAGNELSGRKLSEKCATCHGDDGNADAADTPSLAGQDARYFVKAMNQYLEGERQEESMFKAVDGLSEQDMLDLAAFYAAREPARRNVRTPLTAAEWTHRCERCHGMDGNSTDPRFPMLAGQKKGYLAKSMRAYASNVYDNSTMHAMADPLSESDIESIVVYFASQQPKSVVYLELPCPDAEAE
ncbi:MAG TPA: c-type cytochrome [Xanthomonadales bacterium]|nr:c-type cytochrome [Xanthomonadales bacterium]